MYIRYNNQLLTPTKMRTLVLVPTENKRYITADKINSVGQESGSRRLTVQQRWIVLQNKYSFSSLIPLDKWIGYKISVGHLARIIGGTAFGELTSGGGSGESGELTLSATLTQTQTWAFGEFGLKFYTAGTQNSCVCEVYVQTIMKCECASNLCFAVAVLLQ